MKLEKEKQLVARYKWALYHAACDYSMTKTDCSKCNCRESCKHNPATLGCIFALRRLADVKRREAVDHPAYYKAGGVEAIDVIEAWGLDFCLGNTVKYIARCGRKSENAVGDLKKAAWYLNREIERKEKEDSRNE